MRTGRRVAIGGELMTLTLILKESAPPLALTVTAPVVPAWAPRLRLEHHLAPTGTVLGQVDPVDARGSTLASYCALPASIPVGSQAWQRRGMSNERAGPSATSCDLVVGQRSTGTSGPIWTGIVT